METIISVDQVRKEVIATRNNIHTYRRSATETELRADSFRSIDRMGSDSY